MREWPRSSWSTRLLNLSSPITGSAADEEELSQSLFAFQLCSVQLLIGGLSRNDRCRSGVRFRCSEPKGDISITTKRMISLQCQLPSGFHSRKFLSKANRYSTYKKVYTLILAHNYRSSGIRASGREMPAVENESSTCLSYLVTITAQGARRTTREAVDPRK